MSELDYDFYEFKALMAQTTENLRKMETMQRAMRWQFGEPKEFTDLVQALTDTQNGWVSSNC
jgi:hypothetical protein